MSKKKILELLNDCSDNIQFPDEATQKVIMFKEDGYDELAERLVELFSIAFVSQQRELLIGFLEWQGQNKYNGDTDEEIVDWYLKVKDN